MSPVTKNIEYKAKQIKEFYSKHRMTWEEFYPSERWVFEKIFSEKTKFKDVLDVGCACGGLGNALSNKFSINSYTGVDINAESIDWAKKGLKLQIPHQFIAGDINRLPINKKYSIVISLGCADWNIETARMINTCWDKAGPEGYFVVSLRLTNKKGVNDIQKSFQHIQFEDSGKNFEKANYVVFNFSEAIKLFRNLTPAPETIGAYGYWGKPSFSAVTMFKDLVFAVFYIKKGSRGFKGGIKSDFQLPVDLF